MNKDIICPSCKKTMPLGYGFKHDEKLNFICSYCGEVVFAVTEEDERKVKSVIPATYGWKKELLPIKVGEEPVTEDAAPPEKKTEPEMPDDFEQYALFV